jgi:hypothetical protein
MISPTREENSLAPRSRCLSTLPPPTSSPPSTMVLIRRLFSSTCLPAGSRTRPDPNGGVWFAMYGYPRRLVRMICGRVRWCTEFLANHIFGVWGGWEIGEGSIKPHDVVVLYIVQVWLPRTLYHLWGDKQGRVSKYCHDGMDVFALEVS